MAKMGRRKRSRLNTQAFLASGGVSKKQREAAEADSTAAAAADAPSVAAPKAKTAAKAEAKPAAQPTGDLDIAALADRVKARRREMGWTQGDVAKKGGPAAGMISQIERSLVESPAAEVLAKLDAGLDWPADTAAAILAGRVAVDA
ncbi:helix-turn-helix domain-containing protein [Nocardia sp. NBC_01503]|uniref:helix-turn-helix domain-containing protein n=1 Tax=Nocardia sp. NBC_01503 TaxID=2975997 RepID=UPI002E7ABB47|nr:helix-turn-helix domain-containing protein [Nocardia sp. NBC_01503]WTL32204.1 helix-turn-helix domain-containing protein [Nocardia sp. NBC_01503]